MPLGANQSKFSDTAEIINIFFLQSFPAGTIVQFPAIVIKHYLSTCNYLSTISDHFVINLGVELPARSETWVHTHVTGRPINYSSLFLRTGKSGLPDCM